MIFNQLRSADIGIGDYRFAWPFSAYLSPVTLIPHFMASLRIPRILSLVEWSSRRLRALVMQALWRLLILLVVERRVLALVPSSAGLQLGEIRFWPMNASELPT